MTQIKKCSESVGKLLTTGSKSEIVHSSGNWDESFSGTIQKCVYLSKECAGVQKQSHSHSLFFKLLNFASLFVHISGN